VFLCLHLKSEIDDLGGHRGNTVQALARQRHPVASSEALDVHYRAMHHASCCRICMATKTASNLPLFFVVVDFTVGHNLR
jgi:hypothetical protein